MTNHLHVLIQASDGPLAPTLQQIARRYARYRHCRLDTTGHLFERRYGARFIQDDPYFLTVLRYIHLNPCVANLASQPDEYPWSSHTAYTGKRCVPWVSTDFGLSLFHADPGRARAAYQRFMEAPIEASVHEGWSAWADTTRLGCPSKPSRADRDRHVRSALDQIAQDVCRELLIDPSLLRSANRSRCLMRARVELARRAVSGGIATMRQVAGYLHRTPSAISQLLDRYRM